MLTRDAAGPPRVTFVSDVSQVMLKDVGMRMRMSRFFVMAPPEESETVIVAMGVAAPPTTNTWSFADKGESLGS